ncbi:sperm-associated antigen 7 [Lethenteron reissneri]|uniref:sperm-associated antigen 7 n=1 Tax=Lethenteron reissneri TaxID=7753 RepID=UPI002AB68D9C|nr:sperm-associated antigen 7 [Lethenteron reissneri]
MDLLGSILSSMEKPPSMGDKESRKKAREQAARLQTLQDQERKHKAEFRKQMEARVTAFIKDSSEKKKRFEPMGKLERSILHDVAEVAGLASFSFGDDEESRHVMVFKKEFAPCDDELEAYRRGEEWDPLLHQLKLQERKRLEEEEAAGKAEGPGTAAPEPQLNYRDKYRHLIGTESAEQAAHTLHANVAYGCVPTVNKLDKRSIEEAMNDIRAKKKLRAANTAEPRSAESGGTESSGVETSVVETTVVETTVVETSTTDTNAAEPSGV